MKTIELTNGLFALIDDKDYQRVAEHTWRTHYPRKNGPPYAVYYTWVEGKQQRIYMHRFVMRLERGNPQQVDHIEHTQTLDNRHTNLRLPTRSQSQQNRGRQSNNTSGFKGVAWAKREQKWRAYVKVNGKLKHLGYFATAKEAALVYNTAALKYYGKYAVLNPCRNYEEKQ